MSIWASLMQYDIRGYDKEYPDQEPQLEIDVACSVLSPLIRVSPYPDGDDFYLSREDAGQLAAALVEAVKISRETDEA
jgi:hypothetical protein